MAVSPDGGARVRRLAERIASLVVDASDRVGNQPPILDGSSLQFALLVTR